jgi:hypothetical protein
VLRAFPRHKTAGWILLAAATAWFAFLLGTIDLMEYTPQRRLFVILVLLLGGFSAVYLREFLAVRSLGALLLLAAQVLLDAAFLRDEASRLAITLTAYGFVAAGMAFVGAPYWLRDAVEWLATRESRFRAAAWAGAAWGLLLLAFGLCVY